MKYIVYSCLIVSVLLAGQNSKAAELTNSTTTTPYKDYCLSESPPEILKHIVWPNTCGKYYAQAKQSCKIIFALRLTNTILHHKVGKTLKYIPDVHFCKETVLYLNHLYSNPIAKKLAQNTPFYVTPFPEEDLKLLSILVLYVDIGKTKGDWGNDNENSVLFNLLKGDMYNIHHFKNLLLKHASHITWTRRDTEIIGNQLYKLEQFASDNNTIIRRKTYNQLLAKITPLITANRE